MNQVLFGWLQAAFAPGECLSSADNAFEGPESRRFMYTCSDAGHIIYTEWRASPKCLGDPDRTENRTNQQVITIFRDRQMS